MEDKELYISRSRISRSLKHLGKNVGVAIEGSCCAA